MLSCRNHCLIVHRHKSIEVAAVQANFAVPKIHHLELLPLPGTLKICLGHDVGGTHFLRVGHLNIPPKLFIVQAKHSHSNVHYSEPFIIAGVTQIICSLLMRGDQVGTIDVDHFHKALVPGVVERHLLGHQPRLAASSFWKVEIRTIIFLIGLGFHKKLLPCVGALQLVKAHRTEDNQC